MIVRLLATAGIYFLVIKASAQQFGAFPPSTRWQQIDTDTARILFDNKIATQAQRIAAILHQMMLENRASLGGVVRKIHVVLHPNTTVANGYVALAPFRSEYYLIPGSNVFEFGTTPWNEELAIHEYRHVQQFSNFNKGLAKVGGVLFGQQGQALANALAIPDWFWEGDAVHSETALTVQGRGRSPYFFNGFRALWYQGKAYSWMKLRNGSYKDYVPNHYQLGYLLTNYGYLQYGSQFWGKVTDDASRFRSLLYPFQKAIKRVSGKSFTTFRKEAIEFYKGKEKKSIQKKGSKEKVADYLFPQWIGEDSLFYVKRAYDKIPAFYLADKMGEHRVAMRNISAEDWVNFRKGKVAYTAYSVHPRWGLTDYSDIYLLDINTGKQKKLTQHQKYFTPSFNPAGNLLVAVAFDDSAQSELRLITLDGSIRQRIRRKEKDDLFVHPCFVSDTSLIVAIRHADATMSLQKLNIVPSITDSVKTENLLSRTNAVLGYPFVQGDTVYFVSSLSGSDQVYTINLSSTTPVTKAVQLTTGTTGHYFPVIQKDSLVFSTFTSSGFRLAGVNVTRQSGRVFEIDSFQNREEPYTVAIDSATYNLLDAAGEGDYAIKDYKGGTGLFNFHSRQVTYTDPEVTASVFSDNILNTFSNQVFYRYNQNESSHAVGFNSFYGALFPVLNAGFTYTANRTLRTPTALYTQNQKEVRFGYSIPLNFTSGKTFRTLQAGSNYVYNQTEPTGAGRDSLASFSSGYLQHALVWSQRLPRAVQQLFPKFGYTVNLSHRHVIGGNGFQALGGVTLSIPSIKNHSIVLAGNWQETDTLNRIFSNRFANSRGYNDYYFSRMWRLSGNYHMPLLYPDWGFANILYFLRVRSNIFYDYTRVFSRNKRNHLEQRSIGGEIYFDTKWWNSLPVTIGVRLSHLIDNDFSGTRPGGTNRFEIILPLDLIPR